MGKAQALDEKLGHRLRVDEYAPAVAVEFHRAELIEELVRKLNESARLRLIPGGQSEIAHYETDMTVPDEVSGELRQALIHRGGNLCGVAPSVQKLAKLRIV